MEKMPLLRIAGSVAVIALAFAVLGVAASAQADPVIDGVISPGEWDGAATATIGNGGGTAYFSADTSYIYGAFDITGWTSAMGAASGGNLLGFGVWNADNSYPGDGVEFQQATDALTWGGDGDSGTMNGLVSAFRLDAQTPPAASIPGDLLAMDSFATGHRVWEVKMPISSMTIVDDTVWVVGGINYDKASHWYPDTFLPNYNGYIPVPVVAAASALTCTGFQTPFDHPILFQGKKTNRNLPLKFSCVDEEGVVVDDAYMAANDWAPPVVSVEFDGSFGQNIDGYIAESLPAGLADDGNQFVFNGEHWMLVLGLKAYTAQGDYIISAEPGDGNYTMDVSETYTKFN